MSKKLYAIVDGEVHPFHCYKNYAEMDAIVACANTEEQAMELATMYDHGEVEPSTLQCDKCGGAHEVLQEKGE